MLDRAKSPQGPEWPCIGQSPEGQLPLGSLGRLWPQLLLPLLSPMEGESLHRLELLEFQCRGVFALMGPRAYVIESQGLRRVKAGGREVIQLHNTVQGNPGQHWEMTHTFGFVRDQSETKPLLCPADEQLFTKVASLYCGPEQVKHFLKSCGRDNPHFYEPGGAFLFGQKKPFVPMEMPILWTLEQVVSSVQLFNTPSITMDFTFYRRVLCGEDLKLLATTEGQGQRDLVLYTQEQEAVLRARVWPSAT